MKKILIVLLIVILVFSLIKKENKEEEKEVKAIFISYIELSKYIDKTNIKISKKNIDKMITNIKDLECNTIILQVITAADSIYNSKIYPFSSYVSLEEGKMTFDILDYFIKKSHENDLLLYAWINPYRVRTTTDINSISEVSPAYKYLDSDTIYIDNGIYFNPAKEEVKNLIVEGVKEILEYDIDALMFDDYFYPSKEVSSKDYKNYLENNGTLDEKEYYLNNVNDMIKRVYKECKKKNILFGISPDGNIENNYNKNYADVLTWMSKDGYIDFIMPQIYYGFYNSTKAYTRVIHEWEGYLKNDKIKLLIALAFYKVGREDSYAKEGRDEWINNKDIIMREVLLSRNLKNYQGFSLFRYDYLFSKELFTENSLLEIKNLEKVIK